MKTTIDLPDDLYRQVKIRSAINGQSVREVAIALFEQWTSGTVLISTPSPSTTAGQPPTWFGGARGYARRSMAHDIDSIRESIAEGRTEGRR